jgi:hypothetical protein
LEEAAALVIAHPSGLRRFKIQGAQSLPNRNRKAGEFKERGYSEKSKP